MHHSLENQWFQRDLPKRVCSSREETQVARLNITYNWFTSVRPFLICYSVDYIPKLLRIYFLNRIYGNKRFGEVICSPFVNILLTRPTKGIFRSIASDQMLGSKGCLAQHSDPFGLQLLTTVHKVDLCFLISMNIKCKGYCI